MQMAIHLRITRHNQQKQQQQQQQQQQNLKVFFIFFNMFNVSKLNVKFLLNDFLSFYYIQYFLGGVVEESFQLVLYLCLYTNQTNTKIKQKQF